MRVAANILVVGTLVFVAHAFTAVFSRTRVPDVLLLTVIGLFLGPVFHLSVPENFGAVGPVFATVTLVILLFEAGLSLDLDILRGSIRSTSALTVITFLVTMFAVGAAGYYFLRISPQLTLMLGAIVGSTSPAVIVPLTKRLDMQQSTKTVLFLESAVSDVLSIVVTFGFIDSFRLGKLRLGTMFGQLIATLVLAGVMGALAAISWSALLRRIRAPGELDADNSGVRFRALRGGRTAWVQRLRGGGGVRSRARKYRVVPGKGMATAVSAGRANNPQSERAHSARRR